MLVDDSGSRRFCSVLVTLIPDIIMDRFYLRVDPGNF